MLIAQLSEIAKSYGSTTVLENVHLQVRDGSRVALVGRNGAGKTTLFRLLTGELEPDRGTVWLRRGAVVAAMEQEVSVEDRRTLREEAARGVAHVEELHREFQEVTERLGALEEGSADAQDLLDRYAHLQERLVREDAYTMEARIGAVLTGLHFKDSDLDRPLAEFSGGQKSRAMLARVLLHDPDLLLLDEPTNHLDLAAIEWLEDFLADYQGAFLLVSHDRMFVNRTVNEVVEIRRHKSHHFHGNYDAFLTERERRLTEEARRYEMQQAEVERQKDFIRRNIAGQKTKQAQSRRKMLEKLELLPPPEWPASSIHMTLPPAARSARIVLEAKDLAKSYGAAPVFRDVSFLVMRGQKVGLIGPNGVGKTSLARVLIGEESQTAGTLRVGPEVQIGYYEQEQKTVRGAQSVLNEVWQITPEANETEIRTFLGSFLFRGDDVHKSLNQLSGGERSRVALARLVREGANFLVLDEPTNHLDIESREVFEAALMAFQGTVLVVSHDRYFLDRVVDHVLELRPDGCRVWEGGYSRYAAARKAPSEAPPRPAPPLPPAPRERPPTAAKPAPVTAAPDKDARRRLHEEHKRRQRDEEKLRKRIADAEARIAELERAKENLLLEMAEPEVAVQAERMMALAASLKAREREISEAISEWERLSVRLAGFLDAPN